MPYGKVPDIGRRVIEGGVGVGWHVTGCPVLESIEDRGVDQELEIGWPRPSDRQARWFASSVWRCQRRERFGPHGARRLLTALRAPISARQHVNYVQLADVDAGEHSGIAIAAAYRRAALTRAAASSATAAVTCRHREAGIQAVACAAAAAKTRHRLHELRGRTVRAAHRRRSADRRRSRRAANPSRPRPSWRLR